MALQALNAALAPAAWLVDGAACRRLAGLCQAPLRLVLPAATQEAFADLAALKEQFGRCKKLSYQVQAMDGPAISKRWDELKASADGEFAAAHTRVRGFLGLQEGATRPQWRHQFRLYYVLPIVLHLAKLGVFVKLGVLPMLLFDGLPIATFAAARHPYGASMTVSYLSDLDALPKLIQAAVCCLLWERFAEEAYNSVMPRVDLLQLNTVLLVLYVCWALAHQAYTLHHEDSWRHRRPLEIATSLLSHQVVNISTVYAYYANYKPESPLYLLYTAVGVHQLFQVKGRATQVRWYTGV
eukprot:SAG22_NODE_168_length_16723_cov_6.542409_11_plen_297_part_00